MSSFRFCEGVREYRAAHQHVSQREGQRDGSGNHYSAHGARGPQGIQGM